MVLEVGVWMSFNAVCASFYMLGEFWEHFLSGFLVPRSFQKTPTPSMRPEIVEFFVSSLGLYGLKWLPPRAPLRHRLVLPPPAEVGGSPVHALL